MALGTLLENQDGITGDIRTYSMCEKFKLVTNENRKNQDSPTHTVIMIGRHGKTFDAGVAWEQNHENVGRYYSLSFSVPELFDGEFRCAAFGDGKGQGGFNIVKDREQQQQAA